MLTNVGVRLHLRQTEPFDLLSLEPITDCIETMIVMRNQLFGLWFNISKETTWISVADPRCSVCTEQRFPDDQKRVAGSVAAVVL